MTALLTDNLPLLAGAPNGIKKLRELILELAVRGKLVPQDPEDLSARTGLDASRTERAKAMLEGKIKKEKPAMEVADSEQPFELPDGWAWCRIVDTGNYINGLAFKPGDWSSMGRPIIRIQNLSGRSAEFNRTEREVDASVVVNPGDILVSWSATLDAFIWRGEQGVLNQHIFRVTPSKIVSAQYLYWLLKWAIKVLADSDHAHGLVMAHINRGPFLAQPIGLPPLTEQNKIVVKIAELMALCDRLEARQADADNAHTQLVQALLGSLTQARDAADFAQSWQRLAEHFHTLFTTESSIDALKQTLLQLAVMGKLVAQDPSDEPARELLKSIQLERQAAIFGRNKLKKLRSSDTEDELSFRLPSQWSLARLGELVISGPSNGNSPKPVSVEAPYRCLTLSATTRGTFNNQCYKFVDIDADTASKYFLKEGDLLIQRANSIDYVGVSAIYNGPDDQFIFPDLMMRLRVSQYLNLPFIHAYLSSITGRAYFRNHASGTQGNMPKINQGTVVNAPIPIPPLAEQHRIVAKIDQLMALCDQLKARLNQARQVHEHLASALVEQAVA
ncbi:restriction endonuclease subunit S [Pseudomonas putida]|uniref:restriction endonuclease subunit S n=1 Tax=Pseudomonas putida TaxID=303 RepID=UPI0018AB3909|nr:restriction endonuclease subunit S [Pseudomonas putida]MBF8767129.1 restriction endonuclease subunit S [Pseudomonas putida]